MAADKKNSASKKTAATFYDSAENWLGKNEKRFFYILLFLSLFLSFISFNARISEAHDDALYLEAGWRFVHEFPNYFYTQNAPLYPIFLAILVKLFGFKLILFKLFSVIFNILGFVLFYKALIKRIPAVVFIPVAIFQASNHLIIYFASMTFTEAFYFFLQGLFFFYAGKCMDKTAAEPVDFKKQWKLWLALGLSMFLVSTCKSSAIVVVPAVALFFFLEKNWKALAASVGSYLSIKIVYEALVRTVWHAPSQFKGQSKILLQKDPYNQALGNEDLSGFISRFIENCNLYISKRFYQLLGWRDESNGEVYGFIALLTVALCILGFWFLYKKKSRLLVLLALFTGAQTILSFIILQTRWDQPRIILINMPVLLLLMFYAFYHFTSKPGFGQTAYSAIAVLLIASLLMSSFKRGFKNLPIVQKNLKGDRYYGYTPDWVNFLRCSEWCADSLPPESFVASRKAPMSFVYGKGKKFFPVYSVVKKDTATEQSHPDSALAYFKKNKVTHVMLPQLRVDPGNPAAGFINTMHNIFEPVARTYPKKLRLVHIEGEFEITELYEIRYND